MNTLAKMLKRRCQSLDEVVKQVIIGVRAIMKQGAESCLPIISDPLSRHCIGSVKRVRGLECLPPRQTVCSLENCSLILREFAAYWVQVVSFDISVLGT